MSSARPRSGTGTRCCNIVSSSHGEKLRPWARSTHRDASLGNDAQRHTSAAGGRGRDAAIIDSKQSLHCLVPLGPPTINGAPAARPTTAAAALAKSRAVTFSKEPPEEPWRRRPKQCNGQRKAQEAAGVDRVPYSRVRGWRGQMMLRMTVPRIFAGGQSVLAARL
jgi:hypothetical protein